MYTEVLRFLICTLSALSTLVLSVHSVHLYTELWCFWKLVRSCFLYISVHLYTQSIQFICILRSWALGTFVQSELFFICSFVHSVHLYTDLTSVSFGAFWNLWDLSSFISLSTQYIQCTCAELWSFWTIVQSQLLFICTLVQSVHLYIQYNKYTCTLSSGVFGP